VSDYQNIRVSSEAGVGQLQLHRPERVNALNKATLLEINAALDALEGDAAVRVIVLSGAGRGFSSGFDLKEQMERRPEGAAAWREVLEHDFDFIVQFWDCPKPTIAAVHGYCLAGAFELMLACDITVAAEGTLFGEPEVRFVKGFFRRPYANADGTEIPADGGRVTELAARPLLSAFYPELAGFVQPLAGEVAMRRDLLERMPFATGYAVETAMLLHARDALGGTDGMAQVDLDVRLNQHQPLPDLAPMAYAVLRVVLERLRAEGRLLDGPAPPLQTAGGALVHVDLADRPPYASLRAAA